MVFHSARCEVCRAYRFKEEEVVAYRLTPSVGPVERVDLHGQGPWSGIRVICKTCIGVIASWNGS